MKKQELIKLLDREMLDRLFGFCYSRTNNSHEAEDLSSDITLEILKQAKTDGEIASFIKKELPDYLIPEYKFVADIAAMPVLETLVKALIDDGILEPLKDKFNAETVWMSVKK